MNVKMWNNFIICDLNTLAKVDLNIKVENRRLL